MSTLLIWTDNTQCKQFYTHCIECVILGEKKNYLLSRCAYAYVIMQYALYSMQLNDFDFVWLRSDFLIMAIFGNRTEYSGAILYLILPAFSFWTFFFKLNHLMSVKIVFTATIRYILTATFGSMWIIHKNFETFHYACSCYNFTWDKMLKCVQNLLISFACESTALCTSIHPKR